MTPPTPAAGPVLANGASGPLHWHPHPEVWMLVVGLGLLYAWAVRHRGPLFHPRPDDPPVTRGQIVAFYSALAFVALASASPIHELGEQYLFAVHTVEHLLYALVIPPLLLLGTPRWMARLVLRNPRVRGVVRTLGRPLLAGLAFNAVLLVMNWPLVVEWMVTNEIFHAASHGLLLAAGLVMWLPVASPLPDVPRISLPGQMGYLLLMTLLPTLPASFLTFGQTPLYEIYTTFPRIWGLSAVDDMRIAGLLMKIGGGFFLWTVVAVLFFRWAAAEEAEDPPGAASEFKSTPTTPRSTPE